MKFILFSLLYQSSPSCRLQPFPAGDTTHISSIQSLLLPTTWSPRKTMFFFYIFSGPTIETEVASFHLQNQMLFIKICLFCQNKKLFSSVWLLLLKARKPLLKNLIIDSFCVEPILRRGNYQLTKGKLLGISFFRWITSEKE